MRVASGKCVSGSKVPHNHALEPSHLLSVATRRGGARLSADRSAAESGGEVACFPVRLPQRSSVWSNGDV